MNFFGVLFRSGKVSGSAVYCALLWSRIFWDCVDMVDSVVCLVWSGWSASGHHWCIRAWRCGLVIVYSPSPWLFQWRGCPACWWIPQTWACLYQGWLLWGLGWDVIHLRRVCISWQSCLQPVQIVLVWFCESKVHWCSCFGSSRGCSDVSWEICWPRCRLVGVHICLFAFCNVISIFGREFFRLYS